MSVTTFTDDFLRHSYFLNSEKDDAMILAPPSPELELACCMETGSAIAVKYTGNDSLCTLHTTAIHISLVHYVNFCVVKYRPYFLASGFVAGQYTKILFFQDLNISWRTLPVLLSLVWHGSL